MLTLDYETLYHISSGHMISLFSNDLEKIPQFFIRVLHLFSGPFTALAIITVIGIAYGVYTSLTVFGTVLFLVALQCILASRQGLMRYQIAKQTDKRVNTMNEVLSGMQSIKMLVWERHFISVIQDLRKKEIFKIFVSFMMRVFYKVIGLSGAKVTLFLASITYVFSYHHSMTLPSFFHLMALVMALEAPCFLMFPEALFFASECAASMKRVQVSFTL